MLRKRDIHKRGYSLIVGCIDKIGLPGAIDGLDGVTLLVRHHHRCRRDDCLDSLTGLTQRARFFEIAVNELDADAREICQPIRVRSPTHERTNGLSGVTEL